MEVTNLQDELEKALSDRRAEVGRKVELAQDRRRESKKIIVGSKRFDRSRERASTMGSRPITPGTVDGNLNSDLVLDDRVSSKMVASMKAEDKLVTRPVSLHPSVPASQPRSTRQA